MSDHAISLAAAIEVVDDVATVTAAYNGDDGPRLKRDIVAALRALPASDPAAVPGLVAALERIAQASFRPSTDAAEHLQGIALAAFAKAR